jgi:hypothetical protein
MCAVPMGSNVAPACAAWRLVSWGLQQRGREGGGVHLDDAPVGTGRLFSCARRAALPSLARYACGHSYPRPLGPPHRLARAGGLAAPPAADHIRAHRRRPRGARSLPLRSGRARPLPCGDSVVTPSRGDGPSPPAAARAALRRRRHRQSRGTAGLPGRDRSGHTPPKFDGRRADPRRGCIRARMDTLAGEPEPHHLDLVRGRGPRRPPLEPRRAVVHPRQHPHLPVHVPSLALPAPRLVFPALAGLPSRPALDADPP